MKVLYNEIDPFAAEWLERLVSVGAIPAGDVDRRSIVDIRADDLKGYSQCHFFAGLGVWAYALAQAGWPQDRQVWTGSCPCQPFSGAGHKQGFDDERDLWPIWSELIRKAEPAVVFGEQVAGKAGRAWLARVSVDLRNFGFDVGAADIPGASVGAPHKRARHFFVGSRVGDAACLHEEREQPFTGPGQVEEQPSRGTGAPRRSHSVDGFWANAELVGCRDGWRRPIESSIRHVAARAPNHLAVMRAAGNAIIAPLAIEFVGAFLDAEEEGVLDHA